MRAGLLTTSSSVDLPLSRFLSPNPPTLSVPDAGRSKSARFTKGFAERVAEAKTDQEKWLVRAQKKRFLQENSAIMARRNWMIFNRNASPRNGGTAPPPPVLLIQLPGRRSGRPVERRVAADLECAVSLYLAAPGCARRRASCARRWQMERM